MKGIPFLFFFSLSSIYTFSLIYETINTNTTTPFLLPLHILDRTKLFPDILDFAKSLAKERKEQFPTKFPKWDTYSFVLSVNMCARKMKQRRTISFLKNVNNNNNNNNNKYLIEINSKTYRMEIVIEKICHIYILYFSSQKNVFTKFRFSNFSYIITKRNAVFFRTFFFKKYI